MEIKNLKELQELIKLCRKTGIEAIEVGGIKMNLGPTPVIVRSQTAKSKSNVSPQAYAPGGITEDTIIPTDSLTEEQLMFYSAQGHNEQQ